MAGVSINRITELTSFEVVPNYPKSVSYSLRDRIFHTDRFDKSSTDRSQSASGMSLENPRLS